MAKDTNDTNTDMPAPPARPATPAAAPAAQTAESTTSSEAAFAERQAAKKAENAQAETDAAAEEGRMPTSGAVTNPAPATSMDSPSGAFVEPEITKAIPLDHPAVDNNPRAGTSAVQNGADFNDPNRRDPTDPDFVGTGLDMSVYGKPAA